MLRLAALAATVLVALVLIPPARAASACATRVLRDWSDDGRVASKYSLPCYEEAIEALPTDLRDYSNAEDVISRALTSAVRAGVSGRPTAMPATSPRGIDAGARSAPLALVAAGSVALLLLVVGSLGYALRRRRLGDDLD